MIMRDRPTILPITFDRVSVIAGAASLLSDVTTEIRAGAPTVVMGPNGSGKTTLLKLAMGLISPTTGMITFGSACAASVGRRAIVFQRPAMLRRSAAANVAFALTAAGREGSSATIARLLDQVGLAELANRPARKLSGGEQQRLALARALARDPEVLFLDEPTASLDPAQTMAVETIIARVAACGVKIVMATHDIGEAKRIASDVVFLVRGKLVEQTPSGQFFTSPRSKEAGRFLAGELVL
jgi:tungstate transport system ATP-binding protein